METWPILGLIAGGALFAGVAWWVMRNRRARDAEVHRWGLRHGWTADDGAIPEDGFRTHLFRGRRSRGRSRHVLSLRDSDEQLLLFEHSFLENRGNHTRRVRQTVLAARPVDDGRGGKGNLPEFELRPEKLLDRVASVFGHGDIDFEHRPDFSRRYLLRGADEKAIRGLFDATKLRFFERNDGWSVECDGEWLVIYRARRECRPDDLDGFVEECRQVRELLRPRRR